MPNNIAEFINFLKLVLQLSPLFTKVTVSVLFLLYFNHVMEKCSRPTMRPLKHIFYLLIIRDVIFSALYMVFMKDAWTIEYPYDLMFVLAISDALIFGVYFLWIKQFKSEKTSPVFMFVNIPLILGALAYLVCVLLGVIPSFPGRHMHLILFAWFTTNVILFGVRIYQVSEFNTENSDVIIYSRNMLAVVMSFYALFTYLLMWEGKFHILFVHSLLIPFSYFVHFFVINNYDKMYADDQKQQLDFIQNNLESVMEFFSVLGSAMSDRISLEEILNYIISSTVKTTNADAGSILMIDDYEDILKVRAVSGFFPPLYTVPKIVKTRISNLEAYFQSTPIKIGETILGEAVSSGEPIFIRNSFKDPRMKTNTLNDTLFISSLIVMPLIISKRVLGVLAIVKRDRGKYFSDIDFKRLKTFTEFSSLAIDFILTYIELLEKKELERDLGIAADIQQKLLPRKLPRLKLGTLEAYSIPAKGVSGDYYDVIPLKGEKVALVMCDVAGKGVPAALVMVMIRSILHLVASADKEVSTLLTWVNRGISGQIDIDHYATMSLLFLDQNSGELTYANAAHHPLLIFRAGTKSIETIDTEGLPIGIEKTTKYGQKKAKLNSGDVIVLYTDGIIEAMNIQGEQYTTERFTELVAQTAHLPTKEIIKAIKDDLAEFVGNARQHDDQTLLVMKVN